MKKNGRRKLLTPTTQPPRGRRNCAYRPISVPLPLRWRRCWTTREPEACRKGRQQCDTCSATLARRRLFLRPRVPVVIETEPGGLRCACAYLCACAVSSTGL